ncbi:MAG: type II toxin-antitoxin system Phd/YefM family antitoxin [bacterium]|nr:type II toxin-antitoxin system Phd/YefM family antitoxin [bacterium]
MKTASLHQAKSQLSRLVDAALTGEEVVIARSGTPLVRLVPVQAPKQRRQLGLDAGKIFISDDFDAPMPELERLFYGEEPNGDPDPA